MYVDIVISNIFNLNKKNSFLNERAISLEEVVEAVNEMKSGKAPGLDGFPVESLKKGVMAMLEWLVRLLNLSFDMWVVYLSTGVVLV